MTVMIVTDRRSRTPRTRITANQLVPLSCSGPRVPKMLAVRKVVLVAPPVFGARASGSLAHDERGADPRGSGDGGVGGFFWENHWTESIMPYAKDPASRMGIK